MFCLRVQLFILQSLDINSMTTTIIVLSVICAALALICLYLLLYVYLTNKMLESKDLMIMELQRRVNLENQSNAFREATRKIKEFGTAISSMNIRAGDLDVKLKEKDLPLHDFNSIAPIVNEKGEVMIPGK